MEVPDSASENGSNNTYAVTGTESEMNVLLHGDFVGFAYEGTGADDASKCVTVDLNLGKGTSVDDDVVGADVEVCLIAVAAALCEEFDFVGYCPFDLIVLVRTGNNQ